MPRYRVEHLTRYAYSVAVSQSWQLARLTPRRRRVLRPIQPRYPGGLNRAADAHVIDNETV